MEHFNYRGSGKKIKANYIVQTGFYSDTVVMKLTPPILQNETQVLTSPLALQLKHYINGTTIRYTLDGKDPDSVNSPVYANNTIIDTTALLKAKAFKKGWISSDILQAWFYRSTYTPDSIYLSSEGDYLYKADGAKSLTDHEKGDLSSRTFKWIGFQGSKWLQPCAFNQPVKAKTVTISTLNRYRCLYNACTINRSVGWSRHQSFKITKPHYAAATK